MDSEKDVQKKIDFEESESWWHGGVEYTVKIPTDSTITKIVAKSESKPESEPAGWVSYKFTYTTSNAPNIRLRNIKA
jgi:hypothetical protein